MGGGGAEYGQCCGGPSPNSVTTMDPALEPISIVGIEFLLDILELSGLMCVSYLERMKEQTFIV